MKVSRVPIILFVLMVHFVSISRTAARAAELPGAYYQMMAAELEKVEAAAELPGSPAAMFTAAVLFTQQHPANPSYGNLDLLQLALNIGDVVARNSDQDTAEDRQDYEWEIHFWLDAYRLLESKLEPGRRQRWRDSIRKNIDWFVPQVEVRIDFPRYQGPFIRTSTNHYALWGSAVYQAGRVMKNKEWEELGARAMHRLAAEEQAADGYWGEHTDNGPATGYNYITMACVALYWEHSRDTAALQALRGSTDFHKFFTWRDGTPVETTNGRNRHWRVSPWGHFGFSHWPDGRRYAEFLTGILAAKGVQLRELGRIAQNALYYHEGPVGVIPQDEERFAFQMQVPAGIRRAKPWTVCLSGLFDSPTASQFTLDRQGTLSVYHDRLGMVVSGANSKHQPELATFAETADGHVTTVPFNSRLRMSDKSDRLGMAHRRFFAVLTVAPPQPKRLDFSFEIVEQGYGRMRDATLNLQLVLKAGETLETAHSKHVLAADRIELEPDQIGGWIRHRGWTLHVDPAARLTWPVFGFNPYRNARETELRHAVGLLSVPVKLQPPTHGPLKWRRQGIAFGLSE